VQQTVINQVALKLDGDFVNIFTGIIAVIPIMVNIGANQRQKSSAFGQESGNIV